MARRRFHRGAVAVGVLFIVIGVIYQLEVLNIVSIGTKYIWPAILIGLGIAILSGGHRRYKPVPPSFTDRSAAAKPVDQIEPIESVSRDEAPRESGEVESP